MHVSTYDRNIETQILPSKYSHQMNGFFSKMQIDLFATSKVVKEFNNQKRKELRQLFVYIPDYYYLHRILTVNHVFCILLILMQHVFFPFYSVLSKRPIIYRLLSYHAFYYSGRFRDPVNGD